MRPLEDLVLTNLFQRLEEGDGFNVDSPPEIHMYHSVQTTPQTLQRPVVVKSLRPRRQHLAQSSLLQVGYDIH